MSWNNTLDLNDPYARKCLAQAKSGQFSGQTIWEPRPGNYRPAEGFMLSLGRYEHGLIEKCEMRLDNGEWSTTYRWL